MAGSKPVGVLALQGDYEAHQRALSQLGAASIQVRSLANLQAIQALIIPGGESTTMLKLLDAHLEAAICNRVKAGMPLFVTCAGLILVACDVTNPKQRSLNLLQVAVERNGYGRQLDSFISERLELTEIGSELLGEVEVEGVFIRAPKITTLGENAITLATAKGDSVAVLQENILALSFHPELGNSESAFHRFFVEKLLSNPCEAQLRLNLATKPF